MVEEKFDTVTDSDVRDALLTVWNDAKKEEKQQSGHLLIFIMKLMNTYRSK